MSPTVEETYEGLWGELMFVMHDPEHLWRVNGGRADWLESLGLEPSSRVLDLGCGNGYLDVVLGRRGHRVVGVDQVGAVIAAARALVGDESVEFIASDLREAHFDENRFDLVAMFGVAGLMSVADDRALIERCSGWLKEGGFLFLDCDLELAATQSTRVEHELGSIEWNWTSDPETRTNMLTPELHQTDGVTVVLRDPIDESRGDHTGLHRYIYPIEELTAIAESAGFDVERVGHFSQFVFPDQPPGSYMLRCQLG